MASAMVSQISQCIVDRHQSPHYLWLWHSLNLLHLHSEVDVDALVLALASVCELGLVGKPYCRFSEATTHSATESPAAFACPCKAA